METNIERRVTIEVLDAQDCLSYDWEEMDYDQIADEFREAGINVSLEAIRHNFESWLGNYKSGYRDEENGCFLFTPDGNNPLRFEAMNLQEGREYWQKTYEA